MAGHDGPRPESYPEKFSNDESQRKDEYGWRHLKRTQGNHCKKVYGK